MYHHRVGDDRVLRGVYPLKDLAVMGDCRSWRDRFPDFRTLDSASLIDVISDCARIESALAERRLAATARFVAVVESEYEQQGDYASDPIEVAESQIAAALPAKRCHAGADISLALSLQDRLPRTRAAMATGHLSLFRVRQIESATVNVDRERIDEVEAEALRYIAPDAPDVELDWTADRGAATEGSTDLLGGDDESHDDLDTGGRPRTVRRGMVGRRLTDAIARIIARKDPDGVRIRRARKREERFVGVSDDIDGAVYLNGSLPAEDGRRLVGRLTEMARDVCTKDGRSLDQRRADALMALVDGAQILPCACGGPACPRAGRTVPAQRKPLVHVIIMDSTLRGSDDPGFLDGYGVIGAEHARSIARSGTLRPIRLPEDKRRRASDGPTGEPAGQPVRGVPESAWRYRPGSVLDTWVRIVGGRCQWPGCDAAAWNCDLDHTVPFNHDDPARGGMTTSEGLKPYCRHHHRMKHSGVWKEHIGPDRALHLTAPTGHEYESAPFGVLDVLRVKSVEVVDGGRAGSGPRRSRADNRTARVRAERRACRARRMGRSLPGEKVDPWGGSGAPEDSTDDPPPF